MTNTKEYNEAVEKLADIINKKRVFVPKFDDYEPRIQEGLRDTIKVIIDALGVEIVSGNNTKVYECEIDEVDFCNQIASFKVPEDFEAFAGTYYISNNKPAVYVESIKENIKGAE